MKMRDAKRCMVGLLTVLTVMFMGVVGSAVAETTVSAPIAYDDAITTGTSTVASTGFNYIDAYAALGLSTSDQATAKQIVLRVRSVDEATTAVTICRIGFFNAVPVKANLDGSTARKTGIMVVEGDDIFMTLQGRYFAFAGSTGTARLSVVRAK